MGEESREQREKRESSFITVGYADFHAVCYRSFYPGMLSRMYKVIGRIKSGMWGGGRRGEGTGEEVGRGGGAEKAAGFMFWA